MAANLQSKVVPARTAIATFNHPLLRRLFLVNAVEEIVEFDIKNNTVLVKIIDKLKVAKMRKEIVLPKSKQTIDTRKFALGRTNSLKTTIVIAIINSNEDLKSKLQVPKGFEVQTLLMHGTHLTVTSVDKIARVQRDDELQQGLE